MKRYALFLCFLLFLPVCLAGAEGTVPRTKAIDYPSFAEADGSLVGAELLTENEIRQHFVTGIGKGFLVAEVAVYPKEDKRIEVVPDRFILRIIGKDIALRTENPKVIARALQTDAKPKRDIQVIPHVGVGYESGSPRYNPNGTYDNRGGGVYTSSGVGVIMGGGGVPDASTPADRSTMEIELTEKALPAGETGRPVAGHLYFRVDRKILKDKKQKYELEWEQEGKKIILNLSR